MQPPLLVLSNLRVGLVIARLSKESKISDSDSWKKCLVDILKGYRHVTSRFSMHQRWISTME
jgi:hypothetical protein